MGCSPSLTGVPPGAVSSTFLWIICQCFQIQSGFESKSFGNSFFCVHSQKRVKLFPKESIHPSSLHFFVWRNYPSRSPLKRHDKKFYSDLAPTTLNFPSSLKSDKKTATVGIVNLFKWCRLLSCEKLCKVFTLPGDSPQPPLFHPQIVQP